ncbi:MAG: SH3 domain-containing protein, partial [Eubacterium sp.]|nr:SH3 domain-containing protein [Eubacterium sp.]
MAANNKNHKDGNRSGGFKNIGGTYKKYVAAGAMLALLAVVISNSKVTSNDAKKPQDGLFAETTGDEENTEPFEVDAYPQVNELAEEYFRYYADGDVDAIAKIAHPITETEKSYIKMFSNYLDSYEDIKCYTKKGIEDGEYIVSVTCDMKFQGIDSSAPQIHRFYIRKDEDGTAYIDNAYSQFNQSRQENKTDESINALLAAYEQSKDVISLQKEIKREYDSVLEKDEELKTMVMATMQDAISEWVASFEPQTSEDDNQSQTDKKDTDQTDQLERTAYAKTDVNLREKRSTESDVIKTIKEGAKVTIVGVSKDGWFQIKNGGDTGFVKKEYIESEDAPESGSEDETPADQTQTRTAYAKTKVNLRKKRSTDSEVIKTLKAGTKVTIYGTSQDGWFKVKTGGDTGYVSKEYITTDPS